MSGSTMAWARDENPVITPRRPVGLNVVEQGRRRFYPIHIEKLPEPPKPRRVGKIAVMSADELREYKRLKQREYRRAAR